MKITLTTKSCLKTPAELLVVGTRTIKIASHPILKELDHALEGRLAKIIEREGFKAAVGEFVRLDVEGRLEATELLVVGLGSGEASAEDARILSQRAVQAAKGCTHIAIALLQSTEDEVQRASEGIVSGLYKYTVYKTKNQKLKKEIKQIDFIVQLRNKKIEHAIERGKIIGEAVCFARDLVNAPPNDMHPIALADAAAKKSKELGIECNIWNKKRIQKEKMELFLAVNRGSAIEPRLIHVAWKPARPKKKIVFVGKGLTFDSGGLCLKPANSMITMKCDMAGAATTLAIVFAAAQLKLPIEVHGVIGSTENMTGPEAYRPGDVFKSHQGKTVEIINTDAEGRLVLADVLSWARSLKPDYMIDHATLTGACMVALGPTTAGFFSGDETLSKKYLEAASSEGESFWQLPLLNELRSTLDSDIADLKHTGGPHGGAITAALFLREFVGDTKWAHVDIAGPAFLDRATPRFPKGGTGFGVGAAIRFLENL